MQSDVIIFCVRVQGVTLKACHWMMNSEGEEVAKLHFTHEVALYFPDEEKKSGKCTAWTQQDKSWWKTHHWNNLWFWSKAHSSQWKYSHCLQIALNWDFKESVWQIVLDSRKLWPWHINTFLLWPIKFSQVRDNMWFRWENSGYCSRKIV